MTDKNSWRSLTTVSPDPSDHIVQIDSPTAGSRIKLHRDALVHLLAGRVVPDFLKAELARRGLYCYRQDDEKWPREDLQLWQEHGWGLSLSTYAWSRTVKYHDSGPEENENRVSALRAMLVERSCPPPPVTDSFATPVRHFHHWDSLTVSEALSNRRSLGTFRRGKIKKIALDMLLHYGTRKLRECRHLASTGCIRNVLISVGSAIDIYLIVFAVEGLHPGVYLYEPERSTLVLRKLGNFQTETHQALAGQPDPTNAAVTIIFVADFDRYQWRYRHERALRNLYVEAGRLMQPLILAATAIGLGTGVTPAIRDELIPPLLRLDNLNSQALHTLTVGAEVPDDLPR